MPLANAVKMQTDKLLRQQFHMGSFILEAGQGISIGTNGCPLKGAYVNPPIFILSPPADYTLVQDESNNYIGATLTAIGEDYIVYGYIAICSGLITPIENLKNKGVPLQFNGYASGGGGG